MIQVSSHSEVGGHAANEDAFAVRVHPEDPDCYLCVIADGQGGQAGGGAAARVACAACMDLLSQQPFNRLLLPTTWDKLLRHVDQAVADDPGAGFTTLVAFLLTKDFVIGASSGDSAAAVVDAHRPGHILTSSQRKNPPVGSGAVDFVCFASQLASPWTVLAMTDGVWKYAGWEQLFRAAATLDGPTILRASCDRARLRPGGPLQDDFTLLAFQFQDPGEHGTSGFPG